MSMQREPGLALRPYLKTRSFRLAGPCSTLVAASFRYFFFVPFVILFDLLQRVLCANDDSKIAKSCSAIEVVLQNCA